MKLKANGFLGVRGLLRWRESHCISLKKGALAVMENLLACPIHPHTSAVFHLAVFC